MKNKWLRFMAMFMSFLVLTLPVAFAQRLDVEQFSGTDNVDEIIRPSDDELKVIVTAELRGDPSPDVARKRVRLLHSGEEEFFTSCTSLGNSLFRCEYSTMDLISSGSEEYEIVIVDAANFELKSVKKMLNVDSTPPEITRYSIEPEVSRTGDMEIKYWVEDYGKQLGDKSACAGVKDITVTVDGNVVKTVNFDQPKNCDSGEKTASHQYTTGDKFVGLDVCVVAKDYLGQESGVECETFRIDNSPPVIQSVEFRDAQGYEMSHMKSGQKVVADMFVKILNEDDVVFESVKADLSKLNPGSGDRGPAEVVGDEYIWRDVSITSPSTCEVAVSARDEIGNEASAVLACSLPVDDTGPTPTAIYASAAGANGTNLIGQNGTIYVDFTEEGSGMDKGNAFMDLHNIGLGTVVQADDCIDQGGDVWRCEWHITPQVSTGNYKITVIDGTSDDLGNYATESLSTQVDVDSSPPEISTVDITFIHESSDYGPRAVYGDTIEFIFNTTDAVEAYADLSMIGGANNTPAVECIGTSCKFTALIDVSGPLNATIDFDFYDIARNKESYAYSFIVYGLLANDTVTNYWTSRVTCSPGLIDRSTAELYNHPVYCSVKLTPTNPQADTVFVKPGEFTECIGDFGGYVVDMEVINNNFGSRNPYFVFTLAAAPFEVNELKFACPLYISTRVGDFFSPSIELENVSVNLEFYNLPYGNAYENQEQEIKHAMRKAMGTMKWVGDIEYYIDFARKMCNIKTTVTSALAALDAIIDLLAVAGAAVGLLKKSAGQALIDQAKHLCKKGVGPLEKMFAGDPSDPKGRQKGSMFGSIFNIADLLCKMANCQLSREDVKKYSEDLAVGAAVFGGGISEGACKWYKEFVGGAKLIDYDKLTKDTQTGQVDSPVDIKESIVGSVACTCLPGITYNLNKIRQIYCGYAYCLGKRVLEEGLPRSYCTNEKAYLTCNYVVGQIFEIVPFASLVDKYTKIIQEVYANPISAVTALSALACGGNDGKGGFYDYCEPRASFELDTFEIFMYVACSLPKTAAKVADAVASYQLAEQDWTGDVSEDYCEMAEDLLE
jgi:hypothetical protein